MLSATVNKKDFFRLNNMSPGFLTEVRNFIISYKVAQHRGHVKLIPSYL